MVFNPEIKNFIKNTLILTLFFTLGIHLSWDVIAPYVGMGASASSNDTQFEQKNTTYLGNIATAMSISVGQKGQQVVKTPVQLSSDIISISEVIAHPTDGQKRLIATNMQAITSYINVLSTNIPDLLDRATDRAAALDEHISLLKVYGNETNARLVILSDQITDLKALIQQNQQDQANAKAGLQASLAGMSYEGVDDAIDTYTVTRNASTRAQIYLVYLQKFSDTYAKLQVKNKKLLDALTINRDALIKNTKVIIPTDGTDVLKGLDIIDSEANYNAKKGLE